MATQDSESISLNHSNTNLPLFKTVLLGDVDVGKSSFFVRFKEGQFREPIHDYGLDFENKVYKRQEKSYVLQIWDTAGMERTMSFTENYFRFTHAVLMFYNVNDVSTSTNVAIRWRENANRYCNLNTLYFVIGNKIDVVGSGKITLDDMKSKMADIPRNHFFEISSKTGKGFDECLNKILDIMIESRNPIRKHNSNSPGEGDEEDGKKKFCPYCRW